MSKEKWRIVVEVIDDVVVLVVWKLKEGFNIIPVFRTYDYGMLGINGPDKL